MELHTLGVDGGYTQRDVQELARILTGVGVNLDGRRRRRVRRGGRASYVRAGAVRVQPEPPRLRRQDIPGPPHPGPRLAELDEALDRLARASGDGALRESRKLAVYLLADEPPRRWSSAWRAAFTAQRRRHRRDAARRMFASPRVHGLARPQVQGPGALRRRRRCGSPTTTRVILNSAADASAGCNRMGEGLYDRQTPDGYPLDAGGMGEPGADDDALRDRARDRQRQRRPVPQRRRRSRADARLPAAVQSRGLRQRCRRRCGPATLKALAQAGSPQEWNTFLLSSPEFMKR